MSEFVSIAELPDAIEQLEIYQDGTCESVPVAWEMSLPTGLDLEKIVINMSRLTKIHKAGAMAASLVRGYDGETTEIEHGIKGINPDGSAIAGGTKITKKADRQRTSYEDVIDIAASSSLGLEQIQQSLADMFARPIMMHDINRPEMADQVVDIIDKGKTSEKAWAKVLDIAVRESMRDGARQHLLTRSSTASTMIACIATGSFIGLSKLAVEQDKPVFAVMGAILYGSYQILPEKIRGIAKSNDLELKRRWSILPFGMQPDRYLAVDALTRFPGLIQSKS